MAEDFIGVIVSPPPAQREQLADDEALLLAEHARTVARNIAAIPFPRIETRATDALGTWERLKAEGHGWPVIVGGDDDLAELGRYFVEPAFVERRRSPEDVLALAQSLRFPDGLREYRLDEDRRRATDQGVSQAIVDSSNIVDPWWTRPLGDRTLEVGKRRDPVSEARLLGLWTAKVHILVVPTHEGSAVPAHMGYGGWDMCPPAEWHVAVLRSWRERYGAELVGMGFNSLSLRVAHRPYDVDAALALATEQYLYAPIIDGQGPRTLSSLAVNLLGKGYWRFEWT